MLDGVTLSNDDAEMLLRAIKEFVQITSDEAAQQGVEGERYGFNISSLKNWSYLACKI